MRNKDNNELSIVEYCIERLRFMSERVVRAYCYIQGLITWRVSARAETLFRPVIQPGLLKI